MLGKFGFLFLKNWGSPKAPAIGPPKKFFLYIFNRLIFEKQKKKKTVNSPPHGKKNSPRLIVWSWGWGGKYSFKLFIFFSKFLFKWESWNFWTHGKKEKYTVFWGFVLFLGPFEKGGPLKSLREGWRPQKKNKFSLKAFQRG